MEIIKKIIKKDVSTVVTLTLILLVATATVEIAFSAMNIIKNWLHNRIGD